MRRAMAAALSLAIALLVTACDDSQSDTTSVSQTTVPMADRAVATFLNEFDSVHLNGIPVERSFAVDRERISSLSEGSYDEAVRSDSAAEAANADFARFDDTALLYLGYVYCAKRDEGRPIDRAIASVVAVSALSAGHDPASPADGDYVAAVTIANYASGSLCGDYYLDTRDFLERLGS